MPSVLHQLLVTRNEVIRAMGIQKTKTRLWVAGLYSFIFVMCDIGLRVSNTAHRK